MSEVEHAGAVESVPGIPEPIQKLPSDVMQGSDKMILLTWLAFGIAALCLHKLLWKPILRAVEGREKAISDALDGAAVARKELSESEVRGRQVVAQAGLTQCMHRRGMNTVASPPLTVTLARWTVKRA